MRNFPFSPTVLIFSFIMAIIVWIIRDQYNRKQRKSLTQEIENDKVKVVYLEAKSTRKISSFMGFSVQWENAEVIFTEKSVLYFSYLSLFGYRLYMFVRHLYIPGARVPYNLSRSSIIKDIEIEGRDLLITSAQKFSVVTTRFKDIVSSDQFDVIKKLLDL